MPEHVEVEGSQIFLNKGSVERWRGAHRCDRVGRQGAQDVIYGEAMHSCNTVQGKNYKCPLLNYKHHLRAKVFFYVYSVGTYTRRQKEKIIVRVELYGIIARNVQEFGGEDLNCFS